MDHIQNMGMTQDQQQRITLKRVNSNQRCFKVVNTQRLIYDLNYAVDSKSLAGFLSSESLVPTLVGYKPLLYVLRS
jgi:hypothetical protein